MRYCLVCRCVFSRLFTRKTLFYFLHPPPPRKFIYYSVFYLIKLHFILLKVYKTQAESDLLTLRSTVDSVANYEDMIETLASA